MMRTQLLVITQMYLLGPLVTRDKSSAAIIIWLNLWNFIFKFLKKKIFWNKLKGFFHLRLKAATVEWIFSQKHLKDLQEGSISHPKLKDSTTIHSKIFQHLHNQIDTSRENVSGFIKLRLAHTFMSWRLSRIHSSLQKVFYWSISSKLNVHWISTYSNVDLPGNCKNSLDN
jgi:hypothetical protein